MVEIKINGVSYKNIGTIDKTYQYDWYHNIQTLDGKIHKDLRGKKINYEILFFNDLTGSYNALKTLLDGSSVITLQVPESEIMGQPKEYIGTIQGDEIKGLLWNGKYYHTALKVLFEQNGYEV